MSKAAVVRRKPRIELTSADVTPLAVGARDGLRSRNTLLLPSVIYVDDGGIPFGEEAEEGKPETFDFLGFTHFCSRSRKWGTFVIGRKTIKKRMRARLLVVAQNNARPHRENRRLDETDAARASELLHSLG
jgi:hypothetical protein